MKKNYDLLLSTAGIGFVNAVIHIFSTNNLTGITDARSFAHYFGVAPFLYLHPGAVYVAKPE